MHQGNFSLQQIETIIESSRHKNTELWSQVTMYIGKKQFLNIAEERAKRLQEPGNEGVFCEAVFFSNIRSYTHNVS